jgi:peptide/nickel transport system permease protein
MLAFISRRLILAFFTLVVMSMLSFAVIQLPPGDLISKYIQDLATGDDSFGLSAGGAWTGGTASTIAQADYLREYYGMDKPFYVRYWKWISGFPKLEFGHSFLKRGTSSGQSVKVTEIIQDRLWMTMLLTGTTVLFTFIISFPIGIYSAIRHNSIGDYTASFIGFIGISVPDFLLAVVLMFIFFKYFDQPVGGLFSGEMEYKPWSFAKFLDLLQHLIIPIIVLGTSGTAGLIRILRNNLLDELQKPYVVTAHAKGLSHWKVIMKYPLRIAINPMISGIGQLLPSLIGGSVIVSVILNLPTIGPLLLQAVQRQDTYTGGFLILLLGLLTVIGVLISDIMLVIVDPRIRMWDTE